jgi:hypothetical protein
MDYISPICNFKSYVFKLPQYVKYCVSNKCTWHNFFLLTISPTSNCSTTFKTLHNEEFRHLYRSLRIFNIVKYKRFRRAARIARTGRAHAKAYEMLVGKILESGCLQDRERDGRKTSIRIIRRLVVRMGATWLMFVSNDMFYCKRCLTRFYYHTVSYSAKTMNHFHYLLT